MATAQPAAAALARRRDAPTPAIFGVPAGPPAGTGVSPDSGLSSIALLAARPPAARLDRAPFYALYGAAVAALARGILPRPADAPSPLLPPHAPLLAVAALQAALYLACHWSVAVTAAIRFVRVREVRAATHVRVTPGTFGGSPEIVRLDARPAFDTGRAEPVFDYRRARYVWCPRSSVFTPLPYPDTGPLGSYARSAGVGDRAPAALAAWGPNAISVPVPAFTDLLADQLRAPFFIFQLFCVGLWCLDEYWYYSLFTLAMLVMFESTVAGQRLKNLRDLRGLQAPKPACLVKRGGRWVSIPGEALVPGDLISVGARPPPREGGGARARRGAGPPAPAPAADPAHAGADDAAVPADALLLAGSVVVEEAVLTGESAPQWKAPLYESAAAAAAAAGGEDGADGAAFQQVENADFSARLDAHKRHRAHVLFGGTTVLQHAPDPGAHDPPPDGGCLAVVLRTGYETAQGRLMRTILHAHAGDRVTANSWEAGAFICLLLCFALLAAGYVLAAGLADPHRDRFKLYLNCVMIVTSVVPPELPMELTIAVNASLVALARAAIWCTEPFRIPLAGGVDVACFDKTGTLTSDEMVLEGVAPPATGGGEGGGGACVAGALVPAPDAPRPALRVLAACHSLVPSRDGGLAGDPLERAAFAATGWEAVGEGKVRSPKPGRPGGDRRETLTILRRHHFSAALRRMAAVVADESGACTALVKGAPEAVEGLLAVVPPGYGDAHRAFAARGGRVLALATKALVSSDGSGARLGPAAARALPRSTIEAGLSFAGFAVLGCPLKPESAPACAALAASGHALVMITGDAPLTACHVAGELGITTRPTLILGRVGGGGEGGDDDGGCADPGGAAFAWTPRPVEDAAAAPPPSSRPPLSLPYRPPGEPGCPADLASSHDLCVTGDGLAHAVAAGHDGALVPLVSVWARTAPDQKEHILRVLRAAGAGTLMCGDGTNDVGALKAAHVGVALLASRPPPPPRREGARAPPASHAPGEPPPPPPLRAGGRMLAEMRAAGRPIDARMERLAGWLDRMDAANNPGGAGGAGGGGDEGDGPPLVRPGDASAAAPFTAKAGGAGAVVSVIRQGRATLVTTVQMFKILGLLSLGAAYALSVQYLQGVKLGDGQATVAGLMSAALFFMLSQAKPAESLAPVRPHGSVFCAYALLSLAGQFASHLALLAWSYGHAAAGMEAAAAAGGAAAAAAGLDPAALAAAVAEDAASVGADVAAALNATLAAAGVANASAVVSGGAGGWGDGGAAALLTNATAAANGTSATNATAAAVAAAAAALTPKLALAAARAPDASFTPNLVNTVCYFVTLHLQLATFGANYQGAPYCTPLSQAGALRGVLVYGSIGVAAAVLGALPPLTAALKLVRVPWPLAPRLVLAFGLNFGFCWAWERLLRAALPAKPPRIGPARAADGRVGGDGRSERGRRLKDE